MADVDSIRGENEQPHEQGKIPTEESGSTVSEQNLEEEHACKKLKQECEDLWAELHQEQAALQACYKPNTPKSAEPLVSIYSAKEKLLQAQTQMETENSAPGLPSDPAIQKALLEDELQRSIKELEITISFFSSQMKEMKEEMSRDTQLEDVRQVLEVKLEELKHHQDEPVSERSVLQSLERKKVKADTYHKKLRKQMVEFIQTQFPPPSEEDLAKWNHKQKSRGQTEIRRRNGVVPLETMLEELVNQSMDEPRNPYIILGRDHWPPYVELLVRCGVAQHHPDDDQRLRITPFHL